MNRILLDYFHDILDSILDIESFIDGIDYQSFQNDRLRKNAVIRSLEIIGEATKNIPDDIRNLYSDIPWKRMAGMRDKLIHSYFGVDYEMVWSIIKDKLPEIKPILILIIEEYSMNNN